MENLPFLQLENSLYTAWACFRNVINGKFTFSSYAKYDSFQSWDLLENILESENSSRQILDYLKIFFNFLLGSLQRRGADIVDIFMLWTLLDTEGVNKVFLDTITGFGFKRSDVNNIKLLLAVVCKEHKRNIVGDDVNAVSTVDEDAANKLKESGRKDVAAKANDLVKIDLESCRNVKLTEAKSKDAGRKEAENEPKDPKEKAIESGRKVKLTEAMIPLHDNSVEELLKKWEANEGINIFGMDEELRAVLKRMIAVVIFTLNIGNKTVTGLYDVDNENNNADSKEYVTQKTLSGLDDAHVDNQNNNVESISCDKNNPEIDYKVIQNENNNADKIACNDKNKMEAVIDYSEVRSDDKNIITEGMTSDRNNIGAELTDQGYLVKMTLNKDNKSNSMECDYNQILTEIDDLEKMIDNTNKKSDSTACDLEDNQREICGGNETSVEKGSTHNMQTDIEILEAEIENIQATLNSMNNNTRQDNGGSVFKEKVQVPSLNELAKHAMVIAAKNNSHGFRFEIK